MQWRRKIGACAAAAVFAGSMAACGGSSDGSSGPVELEYWLWQDDATDTTWTDLAEEFNASQDDIIVNLTTIPLDQYQDRLLTAAVSGASACAARSKDWWLGQFAPEGMIADISDYADSWEGSSDIIESLWDTGRLPGDDGLYMLPHQYVTLWLYYNESLLSDAGVDPPATQQEFLDAAVALTDPASGTYGFDVRGGAGGQDQWIAWMFAGGADVVDDIGSVVIDSPQAVRVNDDYLSIVTELDAAPPGSITAAFAQVQTNFAAGTTAMMIHHPGSLNALRETLGEDLGVLPIPVGEGAEPATLNSMSGNVVLESCENKDAAWEWISWLATEEPMREISTSIQGQLPVLESVAGSPPFSDDADLQIAIDAARTSKAWPALAGVAQLAAIEFQTEIQRAFQGDQTGEEMLTNLADLLSQD